MKRLTLVLILCAILFSAALAGANDTQKTITMNKACPSVPGLTMTQVTLTADKTLVDFEWQNMEGEWEISVYAPGDESAFVIRDKRTGRTYELQCVEGMATYPNKVSIKQGEVKKFTLVFDKMPYPYLSAFEKAAELIISADYQ